jgi:hypothetical protein
MTPSNLRSGRRNWRHRRRGAGTVVVSGGSRCGAKDDVGCRRHAAAPRATRPHHRGTRSRARPRANPRARRRGGRRRRTTSRARPSRWPWTASMACVARPRWRSMSAPPSRSAHGAALTRLCREVEEPRHPAEASGSAPAEARASSRRPRRGGLREPRPPRRRSGPPPDRRRSAHGCVQLEPRASLQRRRTGARTSRGARARSDERAARASGR